MAKSIELMIATFDQESQASETLKQLKALAKAGDISILNAAVLKKDDHGKFSVRETQDVNAKQGAAFGAVAGGLIGLLAGPAGAIAGAAAGAAAGGFAAEKIDMGFDNTTLKQFSDDLQPNSSAIIALVEQSICEEVLTTLLQTSSDVFHQSLTEEVINHIETGSKSS